MESAISLALQNNLTLRVERINPELQDLAIAQARTVWTPNLTGSMSTSSRTSPISGFFSGATDRLTRENLGTNVGANQVLALGRELRRRLGHEPPPSRTASTTAQPLALDQT